MASDASPDHAATDHEPTAFSMYTVRRRKRRGRMDPTALAISLTLALLAAILPAILVFTLAPHFEGRVDTIVRGLLQPAAQSA